MELYLEGLSFDDKNRVTEGADRFKAILSHTGEPDDWGMRRIFQETARALYYIGLSENFNKIETMAKMWKAHGENKIYDALQIRLNQAMEDEPEVDLPDLGSDFDIDIDTSDFSFTDQPYTQRSLTAMVDSFYKKAQFNKLKRQAQVLGLGQTAMTAQYMQGLAKQILNALSQPGAPTVKEVDWETRPVLREALQRIIDGQSISDIKDDALFLMKAQNYWDYLSQAGYSSKLMQLLKSAT